MQICTVITTSYYAQAYSLLQSLLDQEPEARLVVCVVDFDQRLAGRLHPRLERVPLEALLPDREERHRRLFRYSPAELCYSLKPLILRHVLRTEARAVYLDSDIRLYHPLAQALVPADILLSPHSSVPLPEDGCRPNNRDFIECGSYNAGFVAVRASPAAEAFLAWWGHVLQAGCLYEHCADQPWLNLVPLYFPEVTLLRHPGCNLAYWNLHARHLSESSEGLRSNGQPLIFVHFSGYDPDRPEQLSRFQNRFALDSQPLLRRLCDEYQRALRTAPAIPQGARYGWGRLASGRAISGAMRRFYHAHPERFPEPFRPGFEAAFLSAWGREIWRERLQRRLPWLGRWLGEAP